MKQRIRLSESDLHRMIKESVKEVLNEVEKLERPKLIKPYSEEYYNSLFTDDDYADFFTDWECDADKYNLFYNYDSELPTRIPTKKPQGSWRYKETPTLKAYHKYMSNRPSDSKERLDWENVPTVGYNKKYTDWFYKDSEIANKNVHDDSSKRFRDVFLDRSDMLSTNDEKINNDIDDQLYKLRQNRNKEIRKKNIEFGNMRKLGDDKPLHRKGSLNREIK